jgi:hypothetical protein
MSSKTRMDGALLNAVTVVLAILIWSVWGLTAIWDALVGSFVERGRIRRWRQSPSGDVLPGTLGWTEREQRVADMIAQIEGLPVERFDAFDPSGVVDRTPLYDVARDVPRDVRKALEEFRARASGTVRERARRCRPEAGAEDYALHNAWFLHEPHWAATEQAAAAGATAILLEGYLDEATRMEWAAAVGRLLGWEQVPPLALG